MLDGTVKRLRSHFTKEYLKVCLVHSSVLLVTLSTTVFEDCSYEISSDAVLVECFSGSLL